MQKYPEAFRWYALAASLADNDADFRSEMDAIAAKVVLLDLSSDPAGAKVYIDKKDLGSVATTPATIALPRGTYTVIVEAQGHEDFVSDPLVLETLGQKTEVDASLTAITGTVRIGGDVGAAVRMGTETGEVLCVTPCEVDLPVGQQLLYFTRDGYRSQPALTEVKADQVVDAAQASLALYTGSIRLDADEQGALVKVDGVPAGFVPAVVNGVAAGMRSIEIVKDGFAPLVLEVRVPRDGQVDLGRVQLEPIEVTTSASRYEEDLFTSGSSVSVITRAEIEAFGYQSLADAFRGTRGVAMDKEFTAYQPVIRGIGGGARVKTTLDSLTVTSNFVNNTRLGTQFIGYMDDVESLELTRGSGSLLYGAGAMSGLIAVNRHGRNLGDRAEVQLGAFGRAGFGRGLVAVGDEDLGAYAGFAIRTEPGYRAQLRNAPIAVYDDEGNPVVRDITEILGGTDIGDATIESFEGGDTAQTYGRAWAKDLELRWHVAYEWNAWMYLTEWPNDPNDRENNDKSSVDTAIDLVYQPQLSDRTQLQFRLAYQRSSNDVTIGTITDVAALNIDTNGWWINGEARLVSDVTDTFRLSAGIEGLRSFESATSQIISGLDLGGDLIYEENPVIVSAYAARGLAAGGLPDDRDRRRDGVDPGLVPDPPEPRRAPRSLRHPDPRRRSVRVRRVHSDQPARLADPAARPARCRQAHGASPASASPTPSTAAT